MPEAVAGHRADRVPPGGGDAAEHQQLGARRAVEQHLRGQPLGHLHGDRDRRLRAEHRPHGPLQPGACRGPVLVRAAQADARGVWRHPPPCTLPGLHHLQLGRAQPCLPRRPPQRGQRGRRLIHTHDNAGFPVGTVHGGTPFAAVPVWPKPWSHGRAEGPLHRSARGAAGDGGGGPRWLAERVDRHRRASCSPRSCLAASAAPARSAAAIGLMWSTRAGGAGNTCLSPAVPSRIDHGRRREIAKSPVLSDAQGLRSKRYWCECVGYRVSVACEDQTVATSQENLMSTERERVAGFGRLEDGLRQASDWYLWGPYVSERQWGTVREDYSADGEAWDYLPHDHARSQAYRWGEDGLAGFSDIEQRLCLGLALWNGRDPILKERVFGLTGAEANHGEDVKEYWWYLDALPSHAWNRWRYHYPQAAFPYENLRAENGRRGKFDPEYELLDTGVFDGDRYWITEVHYAKADPTDLLMTITVTNAGPDADTVHVLPTAWFRNTWSWDLGAPKPVMAAAGEASVSVEHPYLGTLELVAGAGLDGTAPVLLFCENETNVSRLFGAEPVIPYPKDGINDHVIHGAATVNPDQRGTKCAFWYQLEVPPGATVQLRLRLRPRKATSEAAAALGDQFERVMSARRAEADEFYAELTPKRATADEALVMRQAFSGMLWSKQFYNYDVARWLDGDPTQPPPPASRHAGRNSRWRNFNSFDILSMPDKWDYPWFAAWDLAFHCVALAHLDPAFAKYQLILLCREWFQHPNGALPAYEWDFSDVNPPVQAWAAIQVFAIDGGRDVDFLSRIFDKLLVNFTWWVNREDAEGNNLFEGGFLGLDNIGPIDRSHLPAGGKLEQSDATGWMAFYAIAMGSIAAVLNRTGRRPATDLVMKFLEHFAAIS